LRKNVHASAPIYLAPGCGFAFFACGLRGLRFHFPAGRLLRWAVGLDGAFAWASGGSPERRGRVPFLARRSWFCTCTAPAHCCTYLDCTWFVNTYSCCLTGILLGFPFLPYIFLLPERALLPGWTCTSACAYYRPAVTAFPCVRFYATPCLLQPCGMPAGARTSACPICGCGFRAYPPPLPCWVLVGLTVGWLFPLSACLRSTSRAAARHHHCALPATFPTMASTTLFCPHCRRTFTSAHVPPRRAAFCLPLLHGVLRRVRILPYLLPQRPALRIACFF